MQFLFICLLQSVTIIYYDFMWLYVCVLISLFPFFKVYDYGLSCSLKRRLLVEVVK